MTRSKHRNANGKPATAAATQNTLKIMYPAATDVLPVEVPITAWVRYTDAGGNGLPDRRIHLDTTQFATVYPGDVKTDGNGWATTQITFSKPATLGTEASYEATLTATATETPSDTDQVTLHASTTAGGPGILELDDTVDSGTPGSVILGGMWTLITGRYRNADGSPAASRWINMGAIDESGPERSGLNPELASRLVISNDDGQFANFVLTSADITLGKVTIVAQSYNYIVPGIQDVARKTYRCSGSSGQSGATIDLKGGWVARQGIPTELTATYKTGDGSSPDGQTMSWYAAPSASALPFDSPTTQTHDGGLASNQVTAVPARGSFTGALWSEVIDSRTSEHARGALVVWFQNVPHLYPPADERGILNVSSPDGPVWVPGIPHKIEVKYTDYYGNPLSGRHLRWDIAPGNRLVPSVPYPTTTDEKGEASIEVTDLGGDEVNWVFITVRAYNPLSGRDDVGWFQSSLGDTAGLLEILSREPLPLTFYQPHELTATYYTPDNKQKLITWGSGSDSQRLKFDPNPSETNSYGQATTKITAFGDVEQAPVYITIRASTVSTKGRIVSPPYTMLFSGGEAPPPGAARIDLLSLDGDPLSEGDLHLMQATYTKFDGTPLQNQPISWEVEPDANVSLLTTVPTPTDENGVAINGVRADITASPFKVTVTASATNPFTHETDKAALPIVFQPQVSQPGDMSLVSNDLPPLSIGKPHEFTVTYLQSDGKPVPVGTPITWTAFPSRITLDRDRTYTNEFGISTNNVTASPGSDINNAVISARSRNIATGTFDHADVITRFTQPGPVSNLLGVMIDKAYTENAYTLSLGDATQYIEGQVQVLTGGTQQKVLLTADAGSSPAYVLMFDKDGNRLKTDAGSGKSYVMTDTNGLATFMLASLNYTVFKLTASLDTNANDTVSAILAIGDNDATNNPTVPAPQSAAIVNHRLPIPPAPAPTFQIMIPSSTIVVPNSDIAVLLNDRLVYRGNPEWQAGGNLSEEIEIAYAALNLANGGNNSLVYLVSGRESSPLSFTASGTPQIEPDSGGAPRPLAAANVPDTIGPSDIVSPGLKVDIWPYSSIRHDDDVLTVYFYLSGTDALTGDAVNNIVPVQYKVTSGSPLLSGDPVTLILPQPYVAGYATGTLLVDYKVVSSVGTRWSQISATATLNTTL